ncbi:rolling circle replication-associated protein (plasmid) [Sphaerimonospora sp. CA-214678]|uniref:rolling circle replication-associated protein n=1 Tax=Sphaerimonospora sp. CA-214678 TaxID=3240029 RepID=UPI003D909C44
MTSVADGRAVQLPALSDTPVTALWAPKFPSPEGLDLAARLFDARPAWQGEEGPRPRIVIAAGAFAIEAPDLARRERREERALKARQVEADIAATYLALDEDVPERVPSREITGWSRKSRANMVRALCELDYRPMLGDSDRLPAMVTLTYPGDWLTVAPNGKVVKAQLKALRKRYERAWGEPLQAVWKLEFQRRGAPHFHLLLVPPHGTARIPSGRARADSRIGAGLPFRQWLSEVWADIVDHPDPEEKRRHLLAGTGVDYAESLRAYDPKRVAVYFTKHGAFQAKEYQHCVPEEWQAPGQGPGRFWGYWGLERVTAAVEVTPEQAVQAARIARRWARAQGTTRQVSVPRTRGGQARPTNADVIGLAGAHRMEQGSTRRRRVRRRVRRFASGRGFISVNNGQLFAVQLARALSLTT